MGICGLHTTCVYASLIVSLWEREVQAKAGSLIAITGPGSPVVGLLGHIILQQAQVV